MKEDSALKIILVVIILFSFISFGINMRNEAYEEGRSVGYEQGISDGIDDGPYWPYEDVQSVFAYAYQKGYLDAQAGVWGGMTEEYVDGYEFSEEWAREYDSLFLD